ARERPVRRSAAAAPRFRAQGELLTLIVCHTPAASSPPPQELVVERWGERLSVRLTVPPAGVGIYQAAPGRDRLASSRLAKTVAPAGVLRDERVSSAEG